MRCVRVVFARRDMLLQGLASFPFLEGQGQVQGLASFPFLQGKGQGLQELELKVREREPGVLALPPVSWADSPPSWGPGCRAQGRAPSG